MHLTHPPLQLLALTQCKHIITTSTTNIYNNICRRSHPQQEDYHFPTVIVIICAKETRSELISTISTIIELNSLLSSIVIVEVSEVATERQLLMVPLRVAVVAGEQ